MEAAEASKLESYELGVQETKVCLAEELTEVYRDYCKKVSMDAFNLAGVPATSEQRQLKSVYYPLNIREVQIELPAELPPPVTLASVSSEQPLIIQASLPPTEVPKGSGQAGDQGQGVKVNKDKGNGKKVKPLSEAKDLEAAPKLKDAPSKAKDVVVKAKETEAKSKEADPKAKDTLTSQLGNKKGLALKPKAQLRIPFFYASCFLVSCKFP